MHTNLPSLMDTNSLFSWSCRGHGSIAGREEPLTMHDVGEKRRTQTKLINPMLIYLQHIKDYSKMAVLLSKIDAACIQHTAKTDTTIYNAFLPRSLNGPVKSSREIFATCTESCSTTRTKKVKYFI